MQDTVLCLNCRKQWRPYSFQCNFSNQNLKKYNYEGVFIKQDQGGLKDVNSRSSKVNFEPRSSS